MAYYKPDIAERSRPIEDPSLAAHLFVDVQNYNCHKQGAIFQSLDDSAKNDPSTLYFYDHVEAASSNWTALQAACRDASIEVIYTIIQSLTKDGRDRGKDYKLSGFHVPPGCWDAQMLDCITPLGDEIIIPKSSSSVFQSTNIDYVLRNLGIRQLIVCGCVTDQCVEHCVRDACDLGYLVTLVSDASVTYSEERQRASLKAIKGYCRQITTAELIQELAWIKK